MERTSKTIRNDDPSQRCPVNGKMTDTEDEALLGGCPMGTMKTKSKADGAKPETYASFLQV